MTESWVSLACFLERNEPVTQPKAGAQHKQDAPSGVRAGGRLIDAEKDEARKAGPEPEELH